MLLALMEDAMKLAHGVTGHADNGRVKVMWRNREQQPDGSVKRRQRKVTVDSMPEARELAVRIARALKETGWYEHDGKFRLAAEDLEEVLAAYLQHKVSFDRVEDNTRGNIARSFSRWGRGVRHLLGLGGHEMVPAEVMTLDTYRRWVRWATTEGKLYGTGYGHGTVYQTAFTVLDAWSWAADQGRWNTLPSPPYNRRSHLPPNPTYGPPPDTATWAEMDAVINRIASKRSDVYTGNVYAARFITIIQRYTGLRLFQASGIYREDCDVEGSTLLIRRGKSRREKALMRRVVASPHLWVDLHDLLEARVSGPLFPDRKDPTRPLKGYRNTTRYVSRAWKVAIGEGLARATVFSPPNRSKNSSSHALRGAFQARLEDAGVAASVIDHLVGHAPSGTRAQHYVAASVEAQRRAVEGIPAIVWEE